MTILEHGKAICYSGYRDGQNPQGIIPSKDEIKEDLEILLKDGYRYLRMYDPNEHAIRVLEVIRENKYPMQCMIGVDHLPEINNPESAEGKQERSEEELAANKVRNDAEFEKLIALAKQYPEEIFSLSIGNENTPDWGTRNVPVERLICHAKRLKEAVDTPITYCEGFFEWDKIEEIEKLVDFVSVHSYPLHYGTPIDDALAVNKQQFMEICTMYPDKQIIFTELGWSSLARDEIKKDGATPENQRRYIEELSAWLEEDRIIGFLFEAFDENWKGPHEDSCERHWGLYYADRTPKPAAMVNK